MTVSSRSDLAGRGVVDDPAARQDLGQAPVHHLDLAEAADHHVRRLQVAVDHAPGVGIGDRLARPTRRSTGTGAGRRPGPSRPPSSSASVSPLTSFMREERPAVGEGAQLVDRHDPGVLQLAADLRLLDEPADHVGVVAEVLAEHLDGDVAAEVGVAALEHRAHAAAGDLAVDPVAGRAVARPRDRAGRAAARARRRCRGAGRAGRRRASRRSSPARRPSRGTSSRRRRRRGPCSGRRWPSRLRAGSEGRGPRGSGRGSSEPQSGQVRASAIDGPPGEKGGSSLTSFTGFGAGPYRLPGFFQGSRASSHGAGRPCAIMSTSCPVAQSMGSPASIPRRPPRPRIPDPRLNQLEPPAVSRPPACYDWDMLHRVISGGQTGVDQAALAPRKPPTSRPAGRRRRAGRARTARHRGSPTSAWSSAKSRGIRRGRSPTSATRPARCGSETRRARRTADDRDGPPARQAAPDHPGRRDDPGRRPADGSSRRVSACSTSPATASRPSRGSGRGPRRSWRPCSGSPSEKAPAGEARTEGCVRPGAGGPDHDPARGPSRPGGGPILPQRKSLHIFSVPHIMALQLPSVSPSPGVRAVCDPPTGCVTSNRHWGRQPFTSGNLPCAPPACVAPRAHAARHNGDWARSRSRPDRCWPPSPSTASPTSSARPRAPSPSARRSRRRTHSPGPDTINLPFAGTYKITTIGGATDNSAGEFAIADAGDLTIQNTSGGAVTIDGGGLNRVFDVNPAGSAMPFTVDLPGADHHRRLLQELATAGGSSPAARRTWC